MTDTVGISLDSKIAKRQMIDKIAGKGKPYGSLTNEQKMQVDAALAKQTADFEKL